MAEKMAELKPQKKSFLEKFLTGVEVVGDKVPHPAVIFLILIGLVMVLSVIFSWAGASATFQSANIVTGEIDDVTTKVRSLLDADGIRFLFTSMVTNFTNFGVVGVILVAMLGVGLAEEAGLISALIRKLVLVTHPSMITFVIVLLGVISSIATDAGYMVLIPLGAAIYHSLGRHPLAGLAAAFSGVAAGFGVNVLITPLDGMLTEVTNEAIHMMDPARNLDVTANLYFSIASTILVTIVCTVLTDKFVEPRLGVYEGPSAGHEDGALDPAEKKGLTWAMFTGLGIAAVVLLLSLPSWGPLRNPETGSLIVAAPLMDSIIFLVMIVFLGCGIAYGLGAGTIKNSMDIINPIVKTFANLAGLIFLLLVIAQFIAYFAYTNLATVGAVGMADWLETSGFGPVPLLIGFVIVALIIDILMPGGLPAWAILAPIFVPLFMRLGIEPEAVLAAYRVGDSPMNIVTPLMPYFAMIVVFAQKYRPKSGVGTIVAMMLPYTVVLIVVWTTFLVLWFVTGIPWGPAS
ncbi:AbgT family transporter [Arthrobacter glacialis]|uniref:AbgT family transporter n=1 Tax=Arthrobacter glacialis TaxID=1664 RepID=UPI001FAEDA82|nr:AbgT family transporter [Arthrobacter glacialis]